MANNAIDMSKLKKVLRLFRNGSMSNRKIAEAVELDKNTVNKYINQAKKDRSSGLSLKLYLSQIGTSYSTYNYWRKKFSASSDLGRDLAPISIRHGSASGTMQSGDMPSGVSLLFPNGLRAHFGVGSEDVLMELLDKSLSSHVLP